MTIELEWHHDWRKHNNESSASCFSEFDNKAKSLEGTGFPVHGCPSQILKRQLCFVETLAFIRR